KRVGCMRWTRAAGAANDDAALAVIVAANRERGVDRHNNFDLLRLLAAASVIFSHAFLLAENSQDHDPLMMLTGQTVLGVVGVFVFFTISGYLITQSFEMTRSPVVFLAKRGLRI